MTGPRALVAAIGTTLFGALPVFLLGAVAVQIRAEMGFGEAAFGALVSSFFLVSALLSAAAGVVVDRRGSRTAMLLAVATAAVTLVAVAAFGTSWTALLVIVGVAGAGNAFAQPAANLAIVRLVPASRQGLAFGAKQAAVPATTLIGGLGVLLIVSTLGWRSVFVATAVVSLLFLGWLARSDLAFRPSAASARAGGTLRPVAPLLLLGGAACLGAGAANSLAAFLVQGLVAGGTSPGLAGTLLTLGSIAGIVSRVGIGWYCDRRRVPRFGFVAGLLAVGAVGFLMLASGGGGLGLAWAATLLSFGAGWGWAGLFNYSVVLSYPDTPAGATGATQTGIYLGGMLGPLLFGLVAETRGFSSAWQAGAGALVLACALILVARRPIAGRQRISEPSSPVPPTRRNPDRS